MDAMENNHAWWEKLGKPQYGGELNIRLNRKIVNFDPYFGYHLTQIHTAWLEKMFVDDWTLAPEKYDYTKNLRPNQWVKGHLAETWEFTDPYTFVVHLRQGIRWQNIPPANRWEFTADDVAFSFPPDVWPRQRLHYAQPQSGSQPLVQTTSFGYYRGQIYSYL